MISTPPNNSLLRDERGNAFIFILIGIVLFAALAFTIARGFRSEGTSNLNKQQVNLIATELADDAQSMQQAITVMRTKGASESDISFEAPGVAANSKCTYESCKMFSAAGGRIEWKALPSDLVLTTGITGRWGFVGGNEMPGVGTSGGTNKNSDLVAFIKGIPGDVCKQINLKLTGSSTIPVMNNTFDPSTGEPFAGTYGTNVVTVSSGDITGKNTMCMQNGASGRYFFYAVLLAR